MLNPLGRLRSFVTVLFRRRRFEENMADEMRHHIEAYADDLIETGLSRPEALRCARLAFGSMPAVQEESRAARGLARVDTFRQNALFAMRQMLRAPGITIAVLLSLALGIGANTAIFGVMFYDDVRERLGGLPGVSAVAYSARSPLDFSENRRPLEVSDPASALRLAGGASETIVDPHYFDLFGIRLQRGRLVSATDEAGAEPAAVINQTMARRVFGDAEPLGRTVLLGADKHRLTVVGVVEDAREGRLQDAPLPAIYTAMAQSPVDSDGGGGVPRRATVALRTVGDPLAHASSVRRVVGQVDDEAVVTWIRTMGQQVDASIVRERMLARVSGAFSLLAVVLASVGLYGTLSYLVARRTREIGLRLALGATQAGTRRRIVGETLMLAAIGITIGLLAALGAGQVVASFLFGLSPRDPATMAAVAGALLVIALVSGYWPARRAAKVDPMLALRAE